MTFRALVLAASLVWLCAPLAAQDETLQPDGENNPTTVYNDACSSLCNTAACDNDVDEGVGSADGLEVSTLTPDAVIIFDFPTPASNPSTSAIAQGMKFVMSRCDDDINCSERSGGSDPDFSAYVTCAGTDAVTLYTAENITATDQAKNTSFTFPGACSADGSDLGVRIVLASAGGGPNKNFACIEAIDWEVTWAGAADGLMVIGSNEDDLSRMGEESAG